MTVYETIRTRTEEVVVHTCNDAHDALNDCAERNRTATNGYKYAVRQREKLFCRITYTLLAPNLELQYLIDHADTVDRCDIVFILEYWGVIAQPCSAMDDTDLIEYVIGMPWPDALKLKLIGRISR